MHQITVYTKAGCHSRRATLHALDHAGLDYDAIDIGADPKARDVLISLGHAQVLIVLADDRHGSRFRPDHIDDLAREVA